MFIVSRKDVSNKQAATLRRKHVPNKQAALHTSKICREHPSSNWSREYVSRSIQLWCALGVAPESELKRRWCRGGR
jgi:hypothetical protein